MENPIRRRNLLTLAAAMLPASLAVTPAEAATAAAAKVVYHLADLDKVGLRARQYPQSLSTAWAGPANVTIALVVHGPALKAFH